MADSPTYRHLYEAMQRLGFRAKRFDFDQGFGPVSNIGFMRPDEDRLLIVLPDRPADERVILPHLVAARSETSWHGIASEQEFDQALWDAQLTVKVARPRAVRA